MAVCNMVVVLVLVPLITLQVTPNMASAYIPTTAITMTNVMTTGQKFTVGGSWQRRHNNRHLIARDENRLQTWHFMSESESNRNEKEEQKEVEKDDISMTRDGVTESAAMDGSSTTPRQIDVARTSGVFLLEPNDPIASLSASPYTFPSNQQQQQQQQQSEKKLVSYFKGKAMNPNTASMLGTQQPPSPSTTTTTTATTATATIPQRNEDDRPLTPMFIPTESIVTSTAAVEVEPTVTTATATVVAVKPSTLVDMKPIMDDRILVNAVLETDDNDSTTGRRIEITDGTNDIDVVITTMNEDQKVINDLFIINDVYGIDPQMTTSTTTTTTALLSSTTKSRKVGNDTPMESFLDDGSIKVDQNDTDGVRDGVNLQQEKNLDSSNSSNDINNDKEQIDVTPNVSATGIATIVDDAELNEEIVVASVGDSVVDEDDEADADRVVINDLLEVVEYVDIDTVDSINDTNTGRTDDEQQVDGTITAMINEEYMEAEESFIELNTDNVDDIDNMTIETETVPAYLNMEEDVDSTLPLLVVYEESNDVPLLVVQEESNDVPLLVVQEESNDVVDASILLNDSDNDMSDSNSERTKINMEVETSNVEFDVAVDEQQIVNIALANENKSIIDNNDVVDGDSDFQPKEHEDIAMVDNGAEFDAAADEQLIINIALADENNLIIDNDVVGDSDLQSIEHDDMTMIDNGAEFDVATDEQQQIIDDSVVVGDSDLQPIENDYWAMIDNDVEFDVAADEQQTVNIASAEENKPVIDDNDEIGDSDVQSIEHDDMAMIDDGAYDSVLDEDVDVNLNESGEDDHDDILKQEVIIEPTLSTEETFDSISEPLLQRYEENDVDVVDAANQLIVQPPNVPPKISDFLRLQSSIVAASTPEERAELAERSFMSLEVKPGVKVDTIKGAAVASFLLALMAGDELPIALFGIVPAVSYFAITRGKTGETIRMIGDVSWLWTAKFTESITAVDAAQILAAWNVIQSVTTKSMSNFGGWIDQQNKLAEGEWHQNQAAGSTMQLPHQQVEPPKSDYYFMSTLEQLSDNNKMENEQQVEGLAAKARAEQNYEKEMEAIQLLLEEAESEICMAKIREQQKLRDLEEAESEIVMVQSRDQQILRELEEAENEIRMAKSQEKQKLQERNQRNILIAKLTYDRQSSQVKQAIRDHEVARSKLEEVIARQKVTEANQRSLLKTRLAIKSIETARVMSSRSLPENSSITYEEKPIMDDTLHVSLNQNEFVKRKAAEATQRALLETRLAIDRNSITRINEIKRIVSQAYARKLNEAKQRSLLAYRLSLERHITNQSKMAVHVAEVAASRKSTEVKQRALLATRISIDSRLKNRIHETVRLQEETSIAKIKDDNSITTGSILAIDEERMQALAEVGDDMLHLEEANRMADLSLAEDLARKEDEENRLARIDEQIRLEEENRLDEMTRIRDLTRMEEENRLSDEESLRTEIDTLARIEKEKRRAEIAFRSVEAVHVDTLPQPELEDRQTIMLTNDTDITDENELIEEELPSISNRSIEDPLEILKPNVDAAKALLESVRKGSETHQFKKEWWE